VPNFRPLPTRLAGRIRYFQTTFETDSENAALNGRVRASGLAARNHKDNPFRKDRKRHFSENGIGPVVPEKWIGQEPRRGLAWKALAGGVLLAGILLAASLCRGQEGAGFQSPNMFEPRATPADSIFNLSILVFEITGLIFAVVFSLLVYAIVRFAPRREPLRTHRAVNLENYATTGETSRRPVILIVPVLLDTLRRLRLSVITCLTSSNRLVVTSAYR
jgi:hypothetical protein